MKINKTDFESISEIERIIKELGQLIKVRKSDLPTMVNSADFARPSIDVNADGYHYIVVERGKEIRHEITNNLDQLLFWVFEDISFLMAVRNTATENNEGGDQRRAYFSKQVELLDKLNEDWGEVLRQKQAKVLAMCPFDDFARSRARYCKELRESGLSDDVAWQAACERYPLVE